MVIDRGLQGKVLCLALLQGLVLYGLHQAVERSLWPATRPELWFSFGLLALLLPVSLQLLQRQWRNPVLWRALSGLALVLGIVGWHLGAQVVLSPLAQKANDTPLRASALPLAVLWFIVMAFLRARLEADGSRPGYPALFAAAWRNLLTLAEAGLFTGLLTLLLLLGATLFQSLDLPLFRTLFEQPLFLYPMLALAFGIAVQLVGRVDRLVDVVLGQVLGLLKWLAPVAGLLVVLITVALLPRLPGLFSSGDRALNAAWLLWLVAVSVLLLNAAYQDGRVEQPYGRVLGSALRSLPPLLVIVSGTGLYALCVRVGEHGLTVGRYWGLVTAGFALLYAASYSWAALRPGPWMRGVGTANPLLAGLLLVLLLLSLTPVLSPFRLSAQSQQAVQALPAAQLQALSDPLPGTEDWLSTMRVYPAGRELPQALRDVLRQTHDAAQGAPRLPGPTAFWVQAAESDEPELLLLLPGGRYRRYAQQDGAWRPVPLVP